METIEDEARLQGQAQAQLQPRGQEQSAAQREAAIQGHADEQGGKQVQQQQRQLTGPEIVGQANKQQEQEQQQQSQIHHDWSKIETAIATLSDKTLDDCVKRLNSSVFNKVYKSSKVDERKHDISIETFDRIMSEIDDEVKTQDIDKENETKKNEKAQYVGKETRQFISEPVSFVPFFLFDICFALIVCFNFEMNFIVFVCVFSLCINW